MRTLWVTLGPMPVMINVSSARLMMTTIVSKLTLVEPGVSLLLDDAAEGLAHALLLTAAASDVHLALDGDVGVGDARGEELAEGAQEEGEGGRHLALLLDGILHLLEEGVLEDGVDDQHEGRQHTGEERLGALVLEQGHQRAQRRDGLCPAALGRLAGLLGVALALALGPGGDAGVDDPDGVGHDDGGGAGDGAGQDGLDGRELAPGAAAARGGLLKEGLGPLVPVVVYEVGDADAEEGRVDSRVEPGDALAGDDLLHGVDELGLGLSGFDLRSGRESD